MFQTACPAKSPPSSPAPKCLREAADMGKKTGKARLINLLSFFGSCESPPQDLTTVDGTSIWAGDGVHLTSNASRVAARKLMADLVRGDEEGEPANKRMRLESMVSAPAPAKKKGAAAGHLPTSPPRPVPPSPLPLWLSDRHSVGVDPPFTTLPREEVDQCAAMHAAATVVQTVGREGRSEAASSAAGKSAMNSSQQ
jgi:hypothetical protein